MEVAMQKVWRHSAALLLEQSQQSATQAERRLITQTSPFIRTVIDRLTNYAGRLVLRHISGRSTKLAVRRTDGDKWKVREGPLNFDVDTSEGSCNCAFYRTMWLPCLHVLSAFRHIGSPVPIKDRWERYFNGSLGPEEEFLPVPAPGEDADANVLADLHVALNTLKRFDRQEYSPLIRRFLQETKMVLGSSNPFHQQDPAGTSYTRQPRWKSKSKTSIPCNYNFPA